VATIVEADVTNISSVYDKRLGPRIVIQLSNIVTHVGKPLPGRVFSQLGGALPDGSRIEVRELPQFTVGARYILFFSKQASVYSPVWARLAFRVERLANKAIVLGPDSTPVLSFGVEGIKFGRTKLLADDPDQSSKIAGRAFLRDVAQADVDAATAIGPEEFVSRAEQAATSVGAPIGATVTLEPDASERWDLTPTSPQ
jgi:hypothetical protein